MFNRETDDFNFVSNLNYFSEILLKIELCHQNSVKKFIVSIFIHFFFQIAWSQQKNYKVHAIIINASILNLYFHVDSVSF